VRAAAACALSLLLIGCGEDAPAPVETAPNEALRQAVEAPPPAKPKPNPYWAGRDARSRLKAAEKLVRGFEVPLGLKLTKRGSEYLEFTIRASMEELREFYTGVDRKTERRFAPRDYDVQNARNGFDVHHTPKSLGRLRLASKAKESHIYVKEGRNRDNTVRIHTPVAQSDDPRDNPYIPRVNFEAEEKTANARRSPTATGTPPSADPPATPNTYGRGTYKGTAGSTTPPAIVGAAPGTQGRPTINKRWGAAPKNGPGDPKPRIRDWLAKNPGQIFVD